MTGSLQFGRTGGFPNEPLGISTSLSNLKEQSEYGRNFQSPIATLPVNNNNMSTMNRSATSTDFFNMKTKDQLLYTLKRTKEREARMMEGLLKNEENRNTKISE
jgi:hypothetical protein